MADDEKILSIVRLKGPVLPVDIAKGLKTNILLASAYLSELVSRKKIKISSLKIGGSPLYYMPGQEEKLEQFSGNLNEKELRAYEALKEKKMLRDEQLTPLMRVALREIKDFAVPLTVTFENKQELFWKWHLVKDDEVTPLIKNELGMEEKKEVAEVVEDIKKIEEIKEESFIKEPVKVIKSDPIIKEKPKKRGRRKKSAENKVAKEKPLTEALDKEEIKEKLKMKAEVVKGDAEKTGTFADIALDFFRQKEIKVVSSEILRKGADINYIIKIPSPVGELQYLCKAKNKKRSTEKDLSSALVEGQLKRMQVVFLHSGELNAKAKKLAETEPFKTMTFYKL